MPKADGQLSGRVADLQPGSLKRCGLRTGDLISAVDGHPLRDVIDWWWLTSEPAFTLDVRRGNEMLSLHVEREPGEETGVTFAEPIFDGVRECDNACTFCFVAQLPPGLRPSLYIRDDDFRLSFIGGNFVTLTNLTEVDIDRIIEQRLSPLHVSLHTVDAAVRSRLICPTVDDDAPGTLERLLDAGIEFHIQIVLVPGVNDGDVLQETLTWLAPHVGILSVGIVPVGYTAHQQRIQSSFGEPSAASAVIRAIGPWRKRMLAERGLLWAHAADEFYLNAAEPLPEWAEYDDFPQYENGIGLVRAFTDEFLAAAKGETPPAPATLVTGELFGPVLRELVVSAGWENSIRVLPVRNALFGGNVSVTGLLAGSDVVAAIRADGAQARYVLPECMLSAEGLMLDDVVRDDVSRLAGADILWVEPDAHSLVIRLATP
jgi:putative radical SAM enzyme (TIGR03279 family)